MLICFGDLRSNYQLLVFKADVQGQIANMEYQAKQSEAAKEFVKEQQNADVASGEFDQMDVRPEPVRKPVRKSYVQRNGKFVSGSTVELILGERLYWFRKKQFGIDARYIAFAKVKQEQLNE